MLLLYPAIAESGFAALGAARSAASTAEELPAPAVVAPDLLQRFAKISDGRRDQGRIHPVAVVLALCAGAVVAGMSSFTAIAGWVAALPRELLGCSQDTDRSRHQPILNGDFRCSGGYDLSVLGFDRSLNHERQHLI
ncbi:MAG: transposase family protein [Pseudonocardiaceae bacterium]